MSGAQCLTGGRPWCARTLLTALKSSACGEAATAVTGSRTDSAIAMTSARRTHPAIGTDRPAGESALSPATGRLGGRIARPATCSRAQLRFLEYAGARRPLRRAHGHRDAGRRGAASRGLFAARLGGSFVARPAPYRLFWALGFLLFAAGAAAEAYGASGGWSPAAFRIYYLCGGILTVASWAWARPGSTCRAPGRSSRWGRPPHGGAGCGRRRAVRRRGRGALATAGLGRRPTTRSTGHAYLWRSRSTRSARCSSWAARCARRAPATRRREPGDRGRGAVVALSGVLTRLGTYGFVYAAQLAGITLMYVGFELASRPRGGARTTSRAGRGLSLSCAQRGVAQPGRALRLGRSGRPFESARPDRARVPLFRRARAG